MMTDRPMAAGTATTVMSVDLSYLVRRRIFLYLGILIVLLAFLHRIRLRRFSTIFKTHSARTIRIGANGTRFLPSRSSQPSSYSACFAEDFP